MVNRTRWTVIHELCVTTIDSSPTRVGMFIPYCVRYMVWISCGVGRVVATVTWMRRVARRASGVHSPCEENSLGQWECNGSALHGKLYTHSRPGRSLKLMMMEPTWTVSVELPIFAGLKPGRLANHTRSAANRRFIDD